VTFTSSSTVAFLLGLAELGPATRTVSIGPVTSAALRERGHEPDAEASEHDIDGLVQALVQDVISRSDRDASPPPPPPPGR
jgi:uroporphyrinogen-III synthase